MRALCKKKEEKRGVSALSGRKKKSEKLECCVRRRTRPQTTGESSPGPEAPGAQPSSGMWQMPQTSSSVVHVQEATACQFWIFTFMV